MSKRSFKFTITEGNTEKDISPLWAIKELLKAVLIYAILNYVPAAIIIVILALIFKFNVIIPLLIAIPVAFLIGVLIIVLSMRINSQPDRLSECSKDFNENYCFSEENLNWLISEYERTTQNNETGRRNKIIIFLANHYKSDIIQQPQIAAKYLSEYIFDNRNPVTLSKKILRLNYYVCAISTYIHLDDSEKVDSLRSDSSSLFEECSNDKICRTIIRRGLFTYFLYKKEYDAVAELIPKETDAVISSSMKADLLAEQGKFDDARQIYNALLLTKLSELERTQIEQMLYTVDLLEKGELQHIYDYTPITNDAK